MLGSEPDRPLRLFALDATGGALRPIAPEGVVMNSNTIAPDGRSFLGFRTDLTAQRFRLHPVGGGEDVAVPGVEPGDNPVDWADDGRSLFVVVPRSGGGPALEVFRLDTRTGARTPWRVIRPPTRSGRWARGAARHARRKVLRLNIRRIVATLFVVEGLE